MKRDEWKWPLGIAMFVIGAAIFSHHQPHTSGDVAAWVQAFGSIAAIAGAFLIGERQSRASLQAIANAQVLAERSRRNSIFAVAKAAYAHAERIEATFARPDVMSTLFATYDQSIIDSMVSALSASPVHELGSDEAVISFLSLRDHFVFLGRAIEEFIKDGTVLSDAESEDESLIVKIARSTNNIRIQSVRQQLGLIHQHFTNLTKAINGLGTPT